jgi:hypothetical protein
VFTPTVSHRDDVTTVCVFQRCAEAPDGVAHSLFCPRHDPATCQTCRDERDARARLGVTAPEARKNQRSNGDGR